MNEEEEYEEGEEEGLRQTKRYQETLEVTPVPPRDAVLLGSRSGSHLFVNIVLFFMVVSVKCVKDGGRFAHPDMYRSKQSYIFE